MNCGLSPKTFAELKPPGYWSKKAGYFVEVRILTAEESAEREEERAGDFWDRPEQQAEGQESESASAEARRNKTDR